MDWRREQGIAYSLLGILQQYAPNSEAQQLCSKNYNDMLSDGTNPQDLVQSLAGAIYDGKAHGNWPWSSHTASGIPINRIPPKQKPNQLRALAKREPIHMSREDAENFVGLVKDGPRRSGVGPIPKEES